MIDSQKTREKQVPRHVLSAVRLRAARNDKKRRARRRRLVTDSHQGSKAPQCRRTEHDNESKANHAARRIALAPALEHGDESNDEENYGGCTEDFEQHVGSLNGA